MIAIPFEKIDSVEDVRKFFNWLYFDAHVIFHPDNRFETYVELGKGTKSFTDTECKQLNGLMDQCFDVCMDEGEDIYEIGLEVSKHYGERK